MIITEIRKRRHRLVAVYVDGEEYFKISEEIWKLSGFNIGDEIDEEQLCGLSGDSENYLAKEKALYLLEYRPHSKKELEDKISRTVSREAAKNAVEKMESLGLTDDIGYASEYAEMLIVKKGYAPKRAVYELSQKGIDRETAQSVIEDIHVDIIENARSIIERKYPSLDDEKEQKRAVNALLRMGYGYGEIKEIMDGVRKAEDLWQ